MYWGMQVCNYWNLQECLYAGMHVWKFAKVKGLEYVNKQVCRNECVQLYKCISLLIYKYESMHVCMYNMYIYAFMQACKYASSQIFKYAGKQVCIHKRYIYAKSIEICKYTTIRLAIFSSMIVVWIYAVMQKCHVYNFVSMKVYKYEVMQVWDYKNMKV